MTTSLSAALGVGPGDIVSIVGAGGKTTTMYRICHELRARGVHTVSTTTTAIQRPRPHQSPILLLQDEAPDLLAVTSRALEAHGHATVVRRARRADKYEGIDVETTALLARVADVIVIEADGARHARIKAPAEHEPVVPPQTTVFLSVVGLHALGHSLRDVCHRPERAARLVNQPEDSRVSARTMAELLGSPLGGLKGRPPAARAWALLTHLTAENEAPARAIATGLKDSPFAGVVALSHTQVLPLP